MLQKRVLASFSGMGGEKAPKLTQEQMLERLSEEIFDQSTSVPRHAVVEESHPERWWRSDSPRNGDNPDVPRAGSRGSGGFSATNGVLGTGKREGPGGFATQYQTGSGTAAHFKEESQPKMIPGYSGQIGRAHV